MQLIKKYWVYILLLASIVFFVYKKFYLPKKNEGITLKVIQVPNGYGFEIYNHHSLYISQKIIPNIEGYKTFKTPEQAKLIGNLMINKIIKYHELPTVTLHELDSCKIDYK